MPFSFTKAFHCAKAPSGAGRAEHLAFEVLRLGDAGLGRRRDGERRLVVHHHDGDDLLVRVLVLELDQRIDVEEAERIGAGGDAGDAGDRAGAGVDGDVEAFGLVVALVDGDEIGRRRAFELPVEGELDVGVCQAAPAQAGGHRRGRCKAGTRSFTVMVSRSLSAGRPDRLRCVQQSVCQPGGQQVSGGAAPARCSCRKTRHFARVCLFPSHVCVDRSAAPIGRIAPRRHQQRHVVMALGSAMAKRIGTMSRNGGSDCGVPRRAK